jgi:hypothetical protein
VNFTPAEQSALEKMTDVILRAPTSLIWDDRLPETDKVTIDKLNDSLQRIDGMRAIEIAVTGPFARSKIAWKLATYQHVLLHRIIALVDGTAVARNARSTLSSMLSARAFMETLAVFADLEKRTASLLAKGDLGGLDALAQQGIFASRDEEWVKEFPLTKATNILTFIDKFDKVAEGFRAHYDRLSERCHPNAYGHNFLFSALDRSDGTVRFCDEREPALNAHMIMAALIPLPLVESITARLSELTIKVAELHHRVAPVGGSPGTSEEPDPTVNN